MYCSLYKYFSLIATFSDKAHIGKPNKISVYISTTDRPTQIPNRGGEFGPYCFRLMWNWKFSRNKGGSLQNIF